MSPFDAARRSAREIVLDDLAAPRFPDGLGEVLAAMGATPGVPLEPEALMEAAAAQTGLDQFGAYSLTEPLTLLCASLRDDAGLSPSGAVAAGGQLLRHLVTRLRTEAFVREHPEILAVPIDRPIFIAGLQRSGTTHLHNLLAADPALRSLPYWEAVEPLPAPGDPDGEAGVAARIGRVRANIDFMTTALPHFRAIHPISAEYAAEEIDLLTPIFSTYIFENQWRVPKFSEWYATADQRPAYEYLKLMLQILQWQRGGARWVLKSPAHLEQLGPLLSVFPDAIVVLIHRDPVTVTASAATMHSYTARISVASPDPRAIGAFWAARTGRFLTAAVRDRERLPAERSLDVLYNDLVANEAVVLEKIYRAADLPLTDRSRAAHREYHRTHPCGQYGLVRYGLETFGFDLAERRAAARPYSEYFNVPDDPW